MTPVPLPDILTKLREAQDALSKCAVTYPPTVNHHLGITASAQSHDWVELQRALQALHDALIGIVTRLEP